MPIVTLLGLVGNVLSILVLRSPGIDMKVCFCSDCICICIHICIFARIRIVFLLFFANTKIHCFVLFSPSLSPNRERLRSPRYKTENDQALSSFKTLCYIDVKLSFKSPIINFDNIIKLSS